MVPADFLGMLNNTPAQRDRIERFSVRAVPHYIVVEGWLSLSEAFLLYSLAEGIRNVVANPMVVEIGAHLGKSTGIIAHAFGKYGGVVYAVDPWDERANLTDPGKERIYGTENRREKFDFNVGGLPVIAMPGMSAEVSKQFEDDSVDMLFIDGDHTAQGVLLDLDSWTPKMKKGSVLALHDVYTPEQRGDDGYESGPWSAIVERIHSNPTWSQEAGKVDSLFVTRKEI